MAKNPLITNEVREVIATIYLNYPDWRAKEIRDGVEARLHEQNPRSKPGWPGLSAVQKELTKQRKTDDTRPPESKRLDEPWSLGASVKHDIPPDASKDLSDMWRVSLAIDRPISIRQAKWIVYLRTLYQGQSIFTQNYSDKVARNFELISQSWLYSIKERVSEIIGEKHFDTTSLDALISMPYTHWEYETAVKLGKVSLLKFPQEVLAKIEKSGVPLVSPPRSVKSVEQAVWYHVRHEPPPHLEVIAIGFQDKVLPEEADLVAAYWLMYLSKGPLWNRLPEQPDIQKALKLQKLNKRRFDSGGFPDDSIYSRQSSIRRRLLQWVEQNFNKPNPEYVGILSQLMPATPTNLDPDLLKAVGYEITVNSDNNQVKEAQHERLHSTERKP